MFDQTTPPDTLLIPASRLRDICRQLGLAVQRRSIISVLETVLIEATATGTTFRATDLDIEITVTAEDMATAAPFRACVPFRLISRIASSMTGVLRVTHETPEPRDKKLIGDNPARLTIVTDDGISATINLLCPPDDFPVHPMPTDWQIMTLAPTALRRLLSLTAPCISTEETRYYLNGVFLTRKPDSTTLRAVATDGHRMAVIDDATKAPEGLKAIVPTIAVKCILHLVDRRANDDVTVQIAERRIRVISGAIRLDCKLIDGTFPDYTRVLPSFPIQRTVTLTAAALHSLLPFANERSAAVRFADGTATMRDLNLGEVSVPVPMVAAPEATPGRAYGFNLRYLTAQARMTPTFQMALASPEDPARVTGEDPDALWVVMPMRV
jgi:DNA polymerase-3 subunit beta